MRANLMQIQSGYSSANNPQTMSEIYSANYGWLVNLLSKKLHCSQKAADLAQDTFIRLLSNQTRHSIDDLKEPRAYLTTIAQRILFNFYKRQSLEKAYIEAVSNLPDDYYLSVEDKLILLESLQRIDAMLDGLQFKVRTAFLLSQLEGLSYADIALKLNVSQRTIKRYMAVAFEQCLLMDV